MKPEQQDLFSAAAPSADVVAQVLSDQFRSRTPIAQHNREMEEHFNSFWPADPGKLAVVFQWVEVSPADAIQRKPAVHGWLALSEVPVAWRPRAGWLNYHDKQDCLIGTPGADGRRQDVILKRLDLTPAQFAALPVAGGERKL